MKVKTRTTLDQKMLPMKNEQFRSIKKKLELIHKFHWNRKIDTAQKMKFSIKDLFSIYDQIRMKLPIW